MRSDLRVGIAGLGCVGAAVVKLLAEQAADLAARTGRRVMMSGVCVRDRHKDRGVDLSGVTFYDDPVALAQSPEIDLFVELIGGDEGAARQSVEAAFRAGKAVVTANKALLAKHGMALAALAEAQKTPLAFEASVAGGIPIVKTLREGLAGNSISRVYGVLNGTCNYILSRMELESLSFEECLKEAQRLGYAEADPTFDVGGFDTAHKLSILTTLAFGVAINARDVGVEGIERITLADLKAADELGYRIKLLGVAQRTDHGVEQRVHPTMVPKSSAIAQVMGVTNAVTIDADAVKELTLVGPGAGGLATASAVVADIADIAKGVRSAPLGLPCSVLAPAEPCEMQLHEGGYYIRMSVYDRPGAMGEIAACMGDKGISLESIVQRARKSERGGPVPVVLITYATREKNLREALEDVLSRRLVSEPPQVIRIERE